MNFTLLRSPHFCSSTARPDHVGGLPSSGSLLPRVIWRAMPQGNSRTCIRAQVPDGSKEVSDGFEGILDGSKEISIASKGAYLRQCECHDQFEELVPYVEAWRWQKSRVEERVQALNLAEDMAESLIVLQHPPVYTMGTRSSEQFLGFDMENPPFELHRTERGGEVTYHGPGQLVMYPILNLRHHRMDLHWYLRSLEEVVIRALWTSCGLEASRIEGLTGVWIGNEKVAAIGVKVSRWITCHGLALNVNTDLAPFSNIVPCGIADRSVTSITKLLEARALSSSEPLYTVLMSSNKEVPNVKSLIREGKVTQKQSQRWGSQALLDKVHKCLLAEFAAVFELELVPPTLDGPKSISPLSM